MLTFYQTQVERLLQNPLASPNLYALSDLTAYINTARGQLALETGCVRALIPLSTVNGTQQYPLINLTPAPSGFGPIVNVQSAYYAPAGTGNVYLNPRLWTFFETFFLCQAPAPVGNPTDWTQYSTGETGIIFLYPTPNSVFQIYLDAMCTPAALTTDASIDAIPYPYSDAVPYFAAYLAYLSAQRTEDANSMLEKYNEFVARAVAGSGPRMPGILYPSVRDSAPMQRQFQPQAQPERGKRGQRQ